MHFSDLFVICNLNYSQTSTRNLTTASKSITSPMRTTNRIRTTPHWPYPVSTPLSMPKDLKLNVHYYEKVATAAAAAEKEAPLRHLKP